MKKGGVVGLDADHGGEVVDEASLGELEVHLDGHVG